MADHPDYKAIADELFAGDWTHRQVGEYVDANKPAILAALELAAREQERMRLCRQGSIPEVLKPAIDAALGTKA